MKGRPLASELCQPTRGVTPHYRLLLVIPVLVERRFGHEFAEVAGTEWDNHGLLVHRNLTEVLLPHGR